MVELITYYCILWSQYGLKQPSVGIKAGGEEDGVLHAVVGTDLLLQLFVHILGTANEAHG